MYSPVPSDLWKPIKLAGSWSGQINESAGTVEAWRPFLEQLVDDPSCLADYGVLKYSRDRRLIQATVSSLGGLSVVCRYVRVGGGAAWLDRLRGSAGRRDVGRVFALASQGIETPPPFALLERRGRSSESWLVMSYLHRAVDLDRLVLTVLPQLGEAVRRSVKTSVAQAVADFCARLERSGWRHRDIKASNILIDDWDGELGQPRTFIADVEGLRRRYPWDTAAARKMLVRLAASLLDTPGVTRTDLARFIRFYLGARGCPETQWRSLYVDISRRAAAYARAAKRRKGHKLDGFSGA